MPFSDVHTTPAVTSCQFLSVSLSIVSQIESIEQLIYFLRDQEDLSPRCRIFFPSFLPYCYDLRHATMILGLRSFAILAIPVSSFFAGVTLSAVNLEELAKVIRIHL
jgi:hypothetical protein